MVGTKSTVLFLGLMVGVLLAAPASAKPPYCDSLCPTVEIYGGQHCTCENGNVTTCGGWATGGCLGVEDCSANPAEDLDPAEGTQDPEAPSELPIQTEA